MKKAQKAGKKSSGKLHPSHPKAKLMVWVFAFFLWLFVIVVALGFMGFDQSMKELAHVNFKWLAAAFTTFLFSLLVYLLNWTMLIRFLKMPIKVASIAKAMMIGMFVDNILPTITPAGEFMMGYVLHRDSDEPLSKTLASVVIQMISWFVGLIIFSIVVVAVLLYTHSISFELMIAVLFFLILFSLILAFIVYMAIDVRACEKFILAFSGKIFSLTSVFTKKRMDERGKDWIIGVIEEFHRSMAPFSLRKWILVISSANLAFHHFLGALSLFFVAMAFGVHIPLQVACLIIVLTILSSLLTFLPGGIGAFEVVAITLTSFETTVLTATLIIGIYRLMHYWFVVFVGGFLALEEGIETIEAGI